jgi:hypothetical protein
LFMKMRFLALLPVACASLAAQQTGLEGTVIHFLTREPIAGVHIRLEPSGSSSQVWGSVSDRSGHYSMEGMPPGAYMLMPDRTGMVQMWTGADGPAKLPLITLRAGERIRGRTIEMAPVAVIAGRVTDEAGDPVQRAQVLPMPSAPAPPRINQMRPSTVLTDERGEYRIAVPPGKYYVEVQPRPPGASPNAPREIRTDGSVETAPGPAFFPSAAGREEAVEIEAAAGKEVSGVDIRLPRTRLLSISGVVGGMAPGGGAVQITVEGGTGPQNITSRSVRAVGPDGKFILTGLAPGFTRVYATSASGTMQSAIADLVLGTGDVSNLELRLANGEDLAGSLEGRAAGGDRAWVVSLEPAGMSTGRSSSGAVDREGNFRFESMVPGRYRVRVAPLPENAYIEVELDGKAIAETAVDLTRGVRGSRLKVKVGGNGGQISGTVLNANGSPSVDSVVYAMLAADLEDLLGNLPMRADPGGKFTIKGIRPGKYRLAVFDISQISGVSRQASMKAIYEKAPEIEIHEGEKVTRDLKLAAVEAGDAKPKQ